MTSSFEKWEHLDDTLHEGAAPPPRDDEAARRWLVEQRLIHGLLRALHTADAEGRSARLRAVLDRLGPEPTPPGRRLLVAAMVALLIALGLWVLPGSSALPEAEAMVFRARQALAEPVDRRFTLSLLSETVEGERRLRNEYTLTLRPGNRFLLHGEMLLTSFDCGSDGETFWYLPSSPFAERASMPLERARRLEQSLGDVLELGYLDVEDLVGRLPRDFELRSVGREPPRRPGGTALLRVEATRLPAGLERRIETAWLLFEEETGMVERMEIVSKVFLGRRRVVVFEYQGIAEVGEDAYRRPW